MKIKKIGHCCFIAEINNTRILTDPGNFAQGFENIKNIDIVLITHEHADHIHTESLQIVLKNNPDAKIITNDGVGNLLKDKNIDFESVTDGNSTTSSEISFVAFGTKHAEIYRDYGQVENTGYLINNQLFYPGDAFTDPKKPIEILALPVEGPWMALKEAVNYALKLKPKKCFPVHDGRLRPDRIGSTHSVPQKFLGEEGIEFIPLKENEEHEF